MSSTNPSGEIRSFLRRHFRHFNAAELVESAEGYSALIDRGGSMLITLAGALSTAEIGIGLAEMIRRRKVHAICCTGANLEEDVFNLFSHEKYLRVPRYRELSSADERLLLEQGLNRVTDTCIPEDGIRQVERWLAEQWHAASIDGTRALPHEYFYQLVLNSDMRPNFQIDPRDSWVYAAAEARLPMFVPGWEDSTLGNVFASHVINGTIPGGAVIRSGLEYLSELVAWYCRHSCEVEIGLFQIGGGIAGDFATSVVPLIRQDMGQTVPLWSYYCQVGDSTTSYGSYSGAVPNEKISWGKLGPDTPRFMIESDATIVMPLVFACVLGY
ncbi:MAG: deoxyhypusine synthase family protein [Phycisphaerales bacterium]